MYKIKFSITHYYVVKSTNTAKTSFGPNIINFARNDIDAALIIKYD